MKKFYDNLIIINLYVVSLKISRKMHWKITQAEIMQKN